MYGGGVSSSRGRTCNLRSDCYSVILWSDIILSGWVVECEYARSVYTLWTGLSGYGWC